MSIVDILCVALIGLFVWRGYQLGVIRQTASLAGFVIGLVAGNTLAMLLGSSLVVSVVIMILFIALCSAIFEIIGHKIKSWLHPRLLSGVDHISGGVGGLIVGAVVIWIASVVTPAILPMQAGKAVRDSAIIAWIDRSLPPATDIMAALDDALSQQAPQNITELAPVQQEGDDLLPSSAAVNSIAQASQTAVLRIEGRGCNGIGTGSGFVAAHEYVITNAHVIAGMRHPFVKTSDGRRLPARIIQFDTDTDIAILSVEGLRQAPLTLAAAAPQIGDTGAVLGYPGGGEFTAVGTRVFDSFVAVGLDIYGEQPTRRRVYALQGQILPGNSGGPLVSASGQIAGVIFARGTDTESATGFALGPEAVARALADAETRPYQSDANLRCIAPNS